MTARVCASGGSEKLIRMDCLHCRCSRVHIDCAAKEGARRACCNASGNSFPNSSRSNAHTHTRHAPQLQFPTIFLLSAHMLISLSSLVCLTLPSAQQHQLIITVLPNSFSLSSLVCLTLPMCPWDAQLALVLVRHPGNVLGFLKTAKRPAPQQLKS